MRYTAPNPGVMTGPGTNVYWIGESKVTLIDPGPDDPEHIESLAEHVGDRLERIVVTHTHRDHSPGASPLAKLTGARLFGMTAPTTFENDSTFQPDVTLTDGQTLDCDGQELEVVHTPGHASNHVCLFLRHTGLLFTGDHIMEGSTVVIAAPDGDMRAYLDAMARLRAMPLKAIAPGHGHVIDTPFDAIDTIVSHRLTRERQVIEVVTSHGPAEIDVILDVVYRHVTEAIRPVARMSLLAHLTKLRNEGVVRLDNEIWEYTGDSQ